MNKKNNSKLNLCEDINSNNIDLIQKSYNKSNTNSNDKETISYGTFLNLNKNASKKERCNAIYNFYKKIMG
jgi:hypothetical protein